MNTTGHEVGGSLGVAILVTIATGSIGTGAPASTAGLAGGLGDAFLVSGVIAAVSSVAALVVHPSAASFLPKLRLSPRVAVHYQTQVAKFAGKLVDRPAREFYDVAVAKGVQGGPELLHSAE